MKTLKKKLLTMIITLTFLIPFLCIGQDNSGLHKPENEFRPDSLRNDTISVYTCPMHPKIQSYMPGSCPKCGMQLVKKTSSVNKNNGGRHKMKMMCMPMNGMNADNPQDRSHQNKMLIGMGSMMGVMMVIMLILLI